MALPIDLRGLTRSYGGRRGIVDVDVEVREGEVFCFLGPNGAGKTTTIRMLLGLIRPTGGDVTVLGRRIVPGETQAFGHIGYLVETATAYPNLTVRENLEIQRRLTGSPAHAVNETIGLLGLSAYADRVSGKLSLGNKQRLALARALLHSPELLVLDEPANALDPAGIVEVRQLLRRLADERGVTVFMSSHILAEVAHLADRIGIVHNGRLIEESSREELAAKARAFSSQALTEQERADALLTMDLERYFLARTSGASDAAPAAPDAGAPDSPSKTGGPR